MATNSTVPPSPPPLRAGESHVRGAKLLRWKKNLILTMSPDSRGGCPGPLCRMLFAVGRSSEEPSAARSDRDPVHCVARHAVWCHDLLRHRAVWAVERSAVAHDSGAGARDTEPRHLQPCLSHPRSEQLRRGLSALHQGVCDGGQNQGRGSSRRQGAEKSLRTRPKSHAASDGDGVERKNPHGARQRAGAWKQRSGRRFASRRASSAERLHCHRAMAKAIVERGGDYVLAVKNNQPGLLRDAKAAISSAERKKARQATTEEFGHDRKETRTAIVAPVRDMAEEHNFPGLKAVARITSKRGRDKTVERYFLLTQCYTPAELLRIVREHWGIENVLHWTLDVVFDEDQMRSRKDHAPANLAVLRRLALNIARAHPDTKTSLRGKLKRAAWDDSFLVDMLLNMR